MTRCGSSRGLLRTLILVGLLIVVYLILNSTDSSAEPWENETLPDHTQQYYDWAHAYNVQVGDHEQDLVVRRDGGGDPDYLKLPFLSVNDLVTVKVSQRFIADNDTIGGAESNTTCEYYVSDPNKFPIYYYYYQGKPAESSFTFKFAALILGDYYIHTDQGFGDCYIIMNITVTPMSPPSAKDSPLRYQIRR